MCTYLLVGRQYVLQQLLHLSVLKIDWFPPLLSVDLSLLAAPSTSVILLALLFRILVQIVPFLVLVLGPVRVCLRIDDRTFGGYSPVRIVPLRI